MCRSRLGAVVPLAAVALALSACAGLPAARMQLPAALAVASPETLRGLSGGTRGDFQLPGGTGRYERSASRLSLFETVDRSRASARYTLRWGDGREVSADCVGREVTLTVGVISGRTRPYELQCQWRGTSATLNLADRGFVGAAAGTRSERQGRLQFDGGELQLQSVHRVEGSPLPLEAPIGYLVTHQGRPVGAIELNGRTPRIWRPAAGETLHEPVTLAILALALVWDPAG